jgi:hypothetical protein
MTETTGGSDGEPGSASGRRLTLTPISFDVVLALSQVPDGMRLSALSAAIGSPVSSVQAALRILTANGLADRVDGTIPRYLLDAAHPAYRELVALATVLPDPAHAIGIALRASEDVVFAAVDRAGFLASVRDEATADDRSRLAACLERIAAARPGTPPVDLIGMAEFRRLATVSLGLRARLRSTIMLKGRAPRDDARPQGGEPPVPDPTRQAVG